MDVRRESSPEREPVGARLLLPDPPSGILLGPRGLEESDHLRPLDARFDLEEATRSIEAEDAFQAERVEHDPVGDELLPPHCVASAGDGHGSTLTGGCL